MCVFYEVVHFLVIRSYAFRLFVQLQSGYHGVLERVQKRRESISRMDRQNCEKNCNLKRSKDQWTLVSRRAWCMPAKPPTLLSPSVLSLVSHSHTLCLCVFVCVCGVYQQSHPRCCLRQCFHWSVIPTHCVSVCSCVCVVYTSKATRAAVSVSALISQSLPYIVSLCVCVCYNSKATHSAVCQCFHRSVIPSHRVRVCVWCMPAEPPTLLSLSRQCFHQSVIP